MRNFLNQKVTSSMRCSQEGSALSSKKGMELLYPFISVVLAIFVMILPVSGQVIALAYLALIRVLLQPQGAEYGLVAVVAVLFFALDNMAIYQEFFVYTSPNIWFVPFWAPVAWGWWVLHAYRVLPDDRSRLFSGRLVVLAVLFTSGFIVPVSPMVTLCMTAGVLVAALAFFHRRHDLIYTGYFIGIGIVVETAGLTFNLWSYPNRDLGLSIIQFIVMWAGVGLLSRAIVPYFITQKPIYKSDIRFITGLQKFLMGSAKIFR